MDYSAMDRFRDALAGKPGDRVPLFPMIAGWAAANFADVPAPALSRRPDLIAQAQIAAREALGYDSLYAYADALYIPEAFGCQVRFLETGPLVSPLRPSIQDARELPEPDVKTSARLPVILELAGKLGSYSKGRIPVLGMFEGPFTTLCRVVEAEHILRLVYKNPSLLNALLDRIAAFLLQFGRALLESGANVIFIPEPTASASMISPAMFRQFVLPRLQSLTRELPAPCILHICGNTAPLLEAMAQAGADVLSLDQCMELSSARTACPGVSLGGNVDPVDALLLGTKEKVAEAARKCLRQAGTARFVLMSGCGIPPASPIENVRAMVKAAEEYGLGPVDENRVLIKKTICSICNPHSHCGIDAHVKDGVVVKVEGSLENPHNRGTLCSKGAASRQYVHHEDRLRTPLLRTGEKGAGEFSPVSWEEALDFAAKRLNGIRAESGSESVAFFAGYPKWMRPFLKRLAHSFGSPNYCTESSTCSSAAVLAAKLNYGCFGPPDIRNARCLLVWSANPFYSNTSAVRRLLDARERGLKIIEVGPLVTPLTRHADVHLRLRPGTSGALALGMANVIIEEGLYDRDFVEKWTVGFEEFKDYVKDFPLARTEAITRIPARLIRQAARLYAKTKPAALQVSASPTVHHTNGVQNHRALTALIGLTGNFDVRGGNHVRPPAYLYVPGPPVTRQHEYEQSRPWSEMAPRMAIDRFPVWSHVIAEAQAMHLPVQIQSGSPYPIRSVVGFGLNHRMWPGSDFMYESLKKLDFFLHVDLFMTDTGKAADLLLPACTSFERSELKFYPEKFVIWTTPVIDPLGESRPDAEIIFDLAKRIAPEDTLLQKGYEANVDWILAPTGLTVEKLKQHPEGLTLKDIPPVAYRKYEKSGFPTPSGKMEFASNVLKTFGMDPLPTFKEPELSPVSKPDPAKNFPLILTTGARLPMFIHSRTFRLPWTNGLRPDPMLDINPEDAEPRDIAQGDSVLLSTPRNSISVRANITQIVPPGVINIYHGYRNPEINTLFEPDYLDPISGFPGFKSLLCQVVKVPKEED